MTRTVLKGAGLCLALLAIGAFVGAPAKAQIDGARHRACVASSQPALCERNDDKSNKGNNSGKGKDAPKDAQQRALLKSAVARLAPQRDGATDLYTIGVAAWADEDVFLKELDGTITSLARVLPVEGRVLRLVNQVGGKRTAPIASRDNLAAAVNAVAEVMNKREDALILFMTSHGTRGGFLLQVPGRPMVELAPRELTRILDSAGIKNRVVILSACYSGTFVPMLANDDTIIITAADARSPSFGCAPGRDWTYFGDAFFNRSLQPGVDFRGAFSRARITISEWELAEDLPPSNPQAHFGGAIVDKLAPIFAAHAGTGR